MPLLIYGFGSYFHSQRSFNDIDLLIVHEDVSVESCKRALMAKHFLSHNVSHSNITILSRMEEAQLGFLKIANAVLLSTFELSASGTEFNSLIQKIKTYRSHRFVHSSPSP